MCYSCEVYQFSSCHVNLTEEQVEVYTRMIPLLYLLWCVLVIQVQQLHSLRPCPN